MNRHQYWPKIPITNIDEAPERVVSYITDVFDQYKMRIDHGHDHSKIKVIRLPSLVATSQ